MENDDMRSVVAGIGRGRSLMYDNKGDVVLVEYDERGLDLEKLTNEGIMVEMVDRLVQNQGLIDQGNKDYQKLETDMRGIENNIDQYKNGIELVIRALASHRSGKLETISEKDLYDRVLNKKKA